MFAPIPPKRLSRSRPCTDSAGCMSGLRLDDWQPGQNRLLKPGVGYWLHFRLPEHSFSGRGVIRSPPRELIVSKRGLELGIVLRDHPPASTVEVPSTVTGAD